MNSIAAGNISLAYMPLELCSDRIDGYLQAEMGSPCVTFHKSIFINHGELKSSHVMLNYE